MYDEVSGAAGVVVGSKGKEGRGDDGSWPGGNMGVRKC